MKANKKRAGHFKACMRLSLIGLALCSSVQTPVQAQAPEQVLRGIFDVIRQQRQGTGTPGIPGTPGGAGVTAADILGGAAASPAAAASPIPEGAAIWPNRLAFLSAAQGGELIAFRKAAGAERNRVVVSIQYLLMKEYKVPPISQECFQSGGFLGDITGLLEDIADVNAMTLSDEPPSFTNTKAYRDNYVNSINTRLTRMQNSKDRTYCDSEVMGQVVLHPYKAAWVNLAGDYSKATQAFVEGERNRRKAAYQEAAARQQQEAQQRQTAQRAEDQQRLEAEAARIKADEQRRAQKEKSRIGG